MKAVGTVPKNVLFHQVSAKKENCRRKEKRHSVLEKLSHNKYIKHIGSVSATLFTGTLFLGGSYFFFVQLAEYGW